MFIFWRLREPDRWVAARAAAAKTRTTKDLGRLSDLFRHPRWRRNVLAGLGLAMAGQIGLWGVGYYTPELIDSAIPTVDHAVRPKVEMILGATSAAARANVVSALTEKEKAQVVKLVERIAPRDPTFDAAAALSGPLTVEQQGRLRTVLKNAITEDEKTRLKSVGGLLQQVGAFLGMFVFTILATRLGRRPTFAVSFALAWASLIVTFLGFHRPDQIWYLWPVLGFCTLAPFGGYAIYFPELFPTRLRATGTSFCYNVGRYITAFGLLILGPLAKALHGLTAVPGFRLAAIVLASAYAVGLLALIWAPETLHEPLPEEGSDSGA